MVITIKHQAAFTPEFFCISLTQLISTNSHTFFALHRSQISVSNLLTKIPILDTIHTTSYKSFVIYW
jgi:hypothetical protein